MLAARRDSRLVGVLPVVGRRGALRSPTNEHTPAFDLLAEDADAARALADALFAGSARAVSLERLDAGGDGLEAVEAARAAAGYRGGPVPLARSPYIACAPTLEEHERALSRNLRHDVQRRMRRLCEEGAVAVEISDGADRRAELLDEGLAVEESSWKGAGRTAIASSERTRRFYADIASWGAEQGWLRLAFLRLDGRALAFQLDLEEGDRYYSLKIGYDPAYDRYSPGKLLAYAMVARAVARGLASYELLGTNEPWKERWTTTFRERVRVDAYAPSPAGAVTRIAAVHGRRVARRLPLASGLAATLRRR